MNLVSLEKISKQYSERQLLAEVNLLVNEGDRIGLIGINGSGKSTLLRLVAGHRPCAECFRPWFKEFMDTWIRANPVLAKGASLSVDELDAVLHKERIAGKHKVTYQERLSNLPRGTFVMITGDKQLYLVLENALLAWHLEGYGERIARPDDLMVQVLTPRSVVRTLTHGYQTNIHLSAWAGHDGIG